MTTQTLRPRIKEAVSARDLSSQTNERTRGMRVAGEQAVAEPFGGITAGGRIIPGLFPIESTGVSTAPMVTAARAFLASLGARAADATFPVDTDAWRRWSNVHMFLMRHGVSLEGLNAGQREKGLDLMRQTLSAAGFETARNIMKLNETIREITRRDIEFGEWPYWVSIMGDPSAEGPWGWQIDGHHLIVNCFVLGDQVVLSPVFMGSEPTTAPSGTKYAGVSVFGEEDARGLALAQALTPSQKSSAVLSAELPIEVLGAAFRDNFELDYQGLRLDSLSAGQKDLATSLIETYVRRLRSGHDEAWLNAVHKHLDETYFAWIGGTGDDNVFYYRVHSPVILIEFDHLRGIALEQDEPSREHIHTVVRTPNGNDYGQDLLRQHYARHDHRPT